jgi:hypothetical protein
MAKLNPHTLRVPGHPGHNMHHQHLYAYLGLDEKKHLPANGLGSVRDPDTGLIIWIISKEVAREHKMFHRVRAECPCGWTGSAGRVFQHRCLQQSA